MDASADIVFVIFVVISISALLFGGILQPVWVINDLLRHFVEYIIDLTLYLLFCNYTGNLLLLVQIFWKREFIRLSDLIKYLI